MSTQVSEENIASIFIIIIIIIITGTTALCEP
jgi:hypothetical protein